MLGLFISAASLTVFGQQAESLRVRGATLQYRSVGSGRPVVIIGGGAGADAGYMWPVADGLAAAGFRCIVYDQRGRGGSTADALDKAHINLSASIADLDALREHLTLDHMTLLGHSWGAMLAAAYTARYPGRVDRLVLVGPGPLSWDVPFLESYGRRLEARVADQRPAARSATESSLQAALASRRISASAMIADPRSPRERHLFLLYAASAPPDDKEWELMQEDLEVTKFDVRRPLKDWPGSALVIQGDLDALGGEHAKSVAGNFRNGRLIMVNGASHYIWWDRPDEFFGAVNGFLRKVP